MDPQEIKNILKNAKEGIKNKDYAGVLKLCRSIIEKDKENYHAWLFTGAAAFELGSKEQAIAAYQRAIQITPTIPSAWQGLAQLYEKQGVNSELVSIYGELRKLFESDPNKQYDYTLKLANVQRIEGKYAQAINLYYSLLKLKNEERNANTIELLIKLLVEEAAEEIMAHNLYGDTLSYLNESKFDIDVVKKMKLLENYIKAMIKEKISWSIIEKECYALLELSNTNQLAIKTLLEIYVELAISYSYVSQKNEEEVVTKLTELLQRNENLQEFKYFRLVNKLVKFEIDQKSKNEYQAILDEVLSINIDHILSVYGANKYHSYVHDNAETIKTSTNGLKLQQTLIVQEAVKCFQLQFTYNLANAYFEQKKYKNAIESYLEILKIESMTDFTTQLFSLAKRYLVEVYLLSNEHEKAKSSLEEFNKNNNFNENFKQICSILIMIHADSDFLTAFKTLKSLLDHCVDNYDLNFLFAKTCYNLLLNKNYEMASFEKLKEYCLQSLLKAIKLNEYKYETIFCLGNYYKNIINDNKRALKCFQKTYELCGNLTICGLELVDALLNDNKEDITFNLLLKAMDEIPNCKWASLRLGLLHLKQNNPNEAIKLFYNVIRNDPDDFNTWECLAEAYLNRGSLTAALKSFTKALEINPSSNYSEFQIASIKQTLGLYDDAINDYLTILGKLNNHIPTLKGLGETYYLLAKESVAKSVNCDYVKLVESSIKYLYETIKLRDSLCCVWKLLGDCFNLLHVSPDKEISIQVPEQLMEICNVVRSSSSNSTIFTKVELLKLAEKNYMMCCKLKPNNSSYWYDLALVYFYQTKADGNQESDVIFKAQKCILHAITLNQNNNLYWNLLGTIYISKEISKAELAQHCFLKSLQIDEESAITWTNLGAFYLLHNEFKLAHECFKKSQAIDPEYGVAWIGQAYIAETVDVEQCVDLYRHSSELTNHTEALYGYSRVVCKLENDLEFRNSSRYKDYIKRLFAIEASTDCLVKYSTRIHKNPSAYFLCGTLLEKQKLMNTSLKFYEKSINLLSEIESNEEMTKFTRRCYARVLCELNQFEASLMQYQKLDVKTSIDDMLALAKVFFKIGKYQQAYKMYENALVLCNDNEKSMIYTALGMTAFKFKVEDAIVNFFKSFQAKPICIQALFALCSVGFLKNDMKMIAAVFKELDQITDYTYMFDILKLKCIYYSLRKEYVNARKSISKYIHENPHESKGWVELCLCLKRAENYELALEIGRKILLDPNANASLIFYECLQYLLLQQLNKTDEPRKLIMTFQTTLHKFPAHVNSWIIFSKFLEVYKNAELKHISANINNYFNLA